MRELSEIRLPNVCVYVCVCVGGVLMFSDIKIEKLCVYASICLQMYRSAYFLKKPVFL